jgi:type III secretory pathway lipoprotein EscJ
LLALGLLGILVLCGYLTTPVPSGSAFLRNGQKFSVGDIIKISHALDLQHIAYRVDDQRRVEVAADRLDDAKALLAKLNIGPRSIEELDKEAQESNLLDGPWDKERKQSRGQEQILAAMIREFDGIISAYVTINRPRARMGLGRPTPGAHPTAFVWLETDGGREISHKTVQSIQNLIVGKEPDLKPDAVTVFDQKGRHYLVAGDPKYSTLSATRAREEELGQRIRDEIDWIDEVRVTVQLVAAPPPISASVPAPLPALSNDLATPSPSARLPEPTVGVNIPLELKSEPRSNPDVPPTPSPSSMPAASHAMPVPGLPEPPAPKTEMARVWVRVPRSYYLSKAAPERDPSPDRLKEIISRTEALVLVAVTHVLPPELTPLGEPIDLKIDTIWDGGPAGVPLGSPVVTGAQRTLSWWLPAGAAGGGLVVLASVLGVRVLAARRPPNRPRRVDVPGPGHYRRDAPSDASPGPAERVRELIRRNPETAAGVLHRWIGQGESLP